MADVTASIDFVLKQEDAKMSGDTKDDSLDNGGRTRWGIAEAYHPELSSIGFFDSMDRGNSLRIAGKVYSDEYARPMMLASISSQQIANALLSAAINRTASKAIHQAQDALALTSDGKMGPVTLRAINASSVTGFMRSFALIQIAGYRAIVAANPSQKRFLDGWKNRVALATTVTA